MDTTNNSTNGNDGSGLVVPSIVTNDVTNTRDNQSAEPVTPTSSLKRKVLMGEKMKSDTTWLQARKKLKEDASTKSDGSKTIDPFKFLIDHKKQMEQELKKKEQELMLMRQEMEKKLKEEFDQKIKEVCEQVPFSTVSIFEKSKLLDDHIAQWPREWEQQENNCELRTLSPGSKEWTVIEDKMKLTIPNASIEKIERYIIWHSVHPLTGCQSTKPLVMDSIYDGVPKVKRKEW